MYYQLGAYQVFIELQSALFDEKRQLPKLIDESRQARILNDIANAYAQGGRPRRAVPLFEQHNKLQENLNNTESLAIGLGNVAIQQFNIGALRLAETNLERSILLGKEIEDEFVEANARKDLGRILAFRGVWDKAEQELAKVQKYFADTKNYDGLCVVECYKSVQLLLLKDSKGALGNSQSALNAWEEDAKLTYPTIRTLVRTLWLLGASYRLDSQHDLAEYYLTEALMRDRAINMVDHEADILLDLARLRYDQTRYEEAKNLADEALLITERCGYVLQGADVNLFLAQYALEQEQDKVKAKACAETALKLVTCDGPPYYYKVAYDEAEQFLENLK